MRSAPPRERDDEFHVQKWIRLLLSRWAVLALGAVLGATFGFVAARRTPPVYEAAATVALTPPDDRSGMFTAPGVRALLTGQTIAANVVTELGLTSRIGVTPQGFTSQALSVEDVPNTNLFRVKVRLTDPQLAATAATRVGERTAEMLARLWQDMAAGKRTQLERQVEQARLAHVDAEQRLAMYVQRQGLPPRVGSPRGSGRSAQPHMPDVEFEKLETDREVRRKVYIDVAARHEQARIELASTVPPLRLIDAAVPPQQPLPGGHKRTVALGLLAGLVLAASVVMAREWRNEMGRDSIR